MRWCTYESSPNGLERVGLVVDGDVYGSAAGPPGGGSAPRCPAARPRADPPSVRDFMPSRSTSSPSPARSAGRRRPHGISCHFSNPAAIRGPYDDAPVAPGSRAFDYELEVVAVVGRDDLDPATTERHLAGYAVLCDWSARDLQRQESTIGLGPAKGKDIAISLGEFLVTSDELASFRAGNGYRLTMTAAVSG